MGGERAKIDKIQIKSWKANEYPEILKKKLERYKKNWLRDIFSKIRGTLFLGHPVEKMNVVELLGK